MAVLAHPRLPLNTYVGSGRWPLAKTSARSDKRKETRRWRLSLASLRFRAAYRKLFGELPSSRLRPPAISLIEAGQRAAFPQHGESIALPIQCQGFGWVGETHLDNHGMASRPVAAVRSGRRIPGQRCGRPAHANRLPGRSRPEGLAALSWSMNSSALSRFRRLHDAANDIQGLPEAHQKLPHRQAAPKPLAAEGRAGDAFGTSANQTAMNKKTCDDARRLVLSISGPLKLRANPRLLE